jgi:L-fucose isomerase
MLSTNKLLTDPGDKDHTGVQAGIGTPEPNVSRPFQVGLVGFSDGRLRVHETLVGAIQHHADILAKAIASDPLLEAVPATDIVHSAAGARAAAAEMRAAGIEAAVFNIPVFAFPNYSLIAARLLDMPVLLSSPKDPALPGLGGIMAAHGAMAQIGLRDAKMWGNPLEESEVQDTLSAFCRASGVIERLKGSVFGLIGGRSIGMNTGVVSSQEWMRRFGIDVEHIDQLRVVDRARSMADEEVERAYAWMSSTMGNVATSGKAAPEHVKEQIRHYLAIREIVDEYELDFASLKCHYDLSEYHVTGCVSAMFLNDPYDWNGPKDPTVLACEADADGALTMQILKLISGYPTLLFDLRSYDFHNQLYVCCNCGAQPSWYAARSSDPAENLGLVHLEPVISKYGGGGAHFSYVCKSGEITLARLSRVNGEYRMFLARGEFVDFPREKMAETCSAWPHGYVRMNAQPPDLINMYNTNHAHVVPGDHRRALKYYCELMGIPADILD